MFYRLQSIYIKAICIKEIVYFVKSINSCFRAVGVMFGIKKSRDLYRMRLNLQNCIIRNERKRLDLSSRASRSIPDDINPGSGIWETFIKGS